MLNQQNIGLDVEGIIARQVWLAYTNWLGLPCQRPFGREQPGMWNQTTKPYGENLLPSSWVPSNKNKVTQVFKSYEQVSSGLWNTNGGNVAIPHRVKELSVSLPHVL